MTGSRALFTSVAKKKKSTFIVWISFMKLTESESSQFVSYQR